MTMPIRDWLSTLAAVVVVLPLSECTSTAMGPAANTPVADRAEVSRPSSAEGAFPVSSVGQHRSPGSARWNPAVPASIPGVHGRDPARRRFRLARAAAAVWWAVMTPIRSILTAALEALRPNRPTDPRHDNGHPGENVPSRGLALARNATAAVLKRPALCNRTMNLETEPHEAPRPRGPWGYSSR
jgi:hypothetical protein